MPSDRSSFSIQKRLGYTRFPRVEYVNRAGVRVNPMNGKPLIHSENEKQSVTKKKKVFPPKTNGVAFGKLTPIQTNPSVDPPPRVCYNCWQKGHSQNKCPREVKGTFCFNCGRRNKTVENCPRCKDAYKVYAENMLKAGNKKPLYQDEHIMEMQNENDDEDELLFKKLIEQDDKARELLRYNQREYKRDEVRDVSPLSRPTSRYDRSYELYDRSYERETTRYDSEDDDNETKYRDKSPRVKFDEERRHNGRSFQEEKDYSRFTPESREYSDKYYTGIKTEPTAYGRPSREVMRSHYDDRDYGSSYKSSIIEKESKDEEYRPTHRDHYEEERYNNDRKVAESPVRVLSTPSDDPVHEVLELAKSISHLSAETQELIMRQVMAERRQKARLRDTKEEEDIWP